MGRDVFESYSDLRDAMVSTKTLAAIASITIPERGSGIMYAEKLWIAIAAEYILHPRSIPSKFPFVLPYFQLLERCMEIEDMLKKIMGWNASHLMKAKDVLDLHAAIVKITRNQSVLEEYRILARTWSWFEKIRKALRVSREMSSGESRKEVVDVSAMGKDLNSAMSAIMEEVKFAGGELGRISKIFENRIEDHREELPSPVIEKDGKTINVVRHNRIEEIGHRWSRMHIRRRTGRSQTSKEMGMFGALTAILSNMENERYIDKILSRIDFLKEFTSITREEMDKAKKLIRPNPCEPVIRKDGKRKPILDALVKILEIHEELSEKELKTWIESIKI
jgi:hypothetical protein